MKKFLPILLLVFLLTSCNILNPTHTHTYSEEWSNNETSHWHAATCEHTDLKNKEATHTFEDNVCTVCGYVKEVPVHEHTYSTEWSSNETSHWHAATCEHTDLKNKEATHTFEDNVCTVCGYVKETPVHEHTYSTEWSNDENYHWHAATCEHSNEVKDKEEHAFNEEGKCTICDYTKPHKYYLSNLKMSYCGENFEEIYSFDISKNELTKNIKHNGSNGYPIVYKYNDKNQLIEAADYEDGVIAYLFLYSYDEAGNQTRYDYYAINGEERELFAYEETRYDELNRPIYRANCDGLTNEIIEKIETEYGENSYTNITTFFNGEESDVTIYYHNLTIDLEKGTKKDSYYYSEIIDVQEVPHNNGDYFIYDIETDYCIEEGASYYKLQNILNENKDNQEYRFCFLEDNHERLVEQKVYTYDSNGLLTSYTHYKFENGKIFTGTFEHENGLLTKATFIKNGDTSNPLTFELEYEEVLYDQFLPSYCRPGFTKGTYYQFFEHVVGMYYSYLDTDD